jgi:disulfide oxidoreductase YuzD
MKITRHEVKKLLKDIETNFSKLIDIVIYYDSIDQDEYAMQIIEKIEKLPLKKEIYLLIEDIVKRNYTINPSFLYSSIWYYIVNSENKPEVLIDKVASSEYRNDLIKYFNSLNSGKNRLYDINMQKVIDRLKYEN